MSLRLLISIAICIGVPISDVLAQGAPDLLQSMSGTWSVEQRNWTGPNTTAVEGPPALAKRRLIDGKFLEESMQSPTLTPGQDGYFVRDSTVNYNAVSQAFEYFSIDTRAPQAMTYKSAPAIASNKLDKLRLMGGTFVAPEFGPVKNVRFKYRLDVGVVQDGKQTISLYFTPLSVMPRKEFLATEYRYVRQP